MRDIVFFFGAGASFGAGGILPERPPLGGGLFSELRRVWPGTWGALPQEIRAAFDGGNFELGMAEVYQRLGGAIPQLMREMAIYFVQFRPYQRSTLYCRLLDELANRGIVDRVAFSTLNYECVLELSAIERGLSINYFEPADPARVPVWKLHGSCNMFSTGVRAGQGISYGTGVVFEGGIEAFLDANRVIQHCLIETGLAPVMSLYMKGKPLNVSPSAVRQVQAIWVDSVQSARAVCCIGVRPWPADTHIWDVLAQTQAALYFAGGREEYEAWSKARTAPSEFIGATFGTAYSTLIERIATHATN